MLRATLKVVGGTVLGIVLVVAIQFCVAYFRTPAVIARCQQTNEFPLQVSDISANRLQWYLQVEDPSFYHHRGVDWMTPGAGYTTITQGVVKRLFYTEPFTPGFLRWRKLQQTIIAVAFNARVPKNEQLRLALNLSFMGRRNGHAVYGFSQASREYFGKEERSLSDDEFLSLVATIVAPDNLSPVAHAAENEERVQRIHGLIEGRCRPLSVADVEYAGCRLFAQSAMAQIVRKVDCADGGTVHITYADGRMKTIPPDEQQVGCDRISVASDKRTVAWDALIENYATSYPIPAGVIVYRDGKKVTLYAELQTVWDWTFIGQGDSIAVLTGPVHGNASEANLYDSRTGRVLEHWEGEGAAPEWAAAWRDEFAQRSQPE